MYLSYLYCSFGVFVQNNFASVAMKSFSFSDWWRHVIKQLRIFSCWRRTRQRRFSRTTFSSATRFRSASCSTLSTASRPTAATCSTSASCRPSSRARAATCANAKIKSWRRYGFPELWRRKISQDLLAFNLGDKLKKMNNIICSQWISAIVLICLVAILERGRWLPRRRNGGNSTTLSFACSVLL